MNKEVSQKDKILVNENTFNDTNNEVICLGS